VPDEAAPLVVAQLRAAGYADAAVIGHFFAIPAEEGKGAKELFNISTASTASTAASSSSSSIVREDPSTCPVEANEILVWLDEA
jgi:hypothetical protein